MKPMTAPDATNHIDNGVAEVRERIAQELSATSFGQRLTETRADVLGGKMLRGRLMLSLGHATTVSVDKLYTLAAAVEMLQIASLLHDDLLDQGTVRRGSPSFWVTDGVKSAVLLGDLLLALSVGLVQRALPDAVGLLSQTITDMCNAEVDQENLADKQIRGAREEAMGIARRKTGSLFGFAARCAAGEDSVLGEALRLAGSDLGTAYQMADDCFDQRSDIAAPDKTMGADARNNKLTTARFSGCELMAPAAGMQTLLQQARTRLNDWPHVQQAWDAFTETILLPQIRALSGVTI